MTSFEGETYPEKAGLNGPRYRAHFASRINTWIILDELRVPPDVSLNEEIPEEAKIELPVGAVRTLIKKVADTEQIDSILADQKYKPKERDRHLDLIEELIDQSKDMVSEELLKQLLRGE